MPKVSFILSAYKRRFRHEDGRLDLYDYDLTTNVWTETVTHLHEQSPAPVNGKTTRDVTVTNRRGEIIERRAEAFVDGNWYTIARDRMTYNTTGKRIRTENLAGQVTTTAWDCCHKVSEVGPDGSATTWDYDDEGRMVATSRLIPLDMTNVTWTTTCYGYDDLDRQTATWRTNYTAKVGTPVTHTSYDALGRVIARTDVLGNATTTSYSPDGRTVSVREPNAATTVTVRNADGDVLSITGTGVTPEFHTRGVQQDGMRWSRTVQGETASSPRFNKRYENLLGQTVREERSGFGGAVLAAVSAYDGYGRLVRTTSDGEPTTEYAYDSFGNRIAATRTVGADHRAAREWRKFETSSAYALGDGRAWLVQTNVTSCSDASIAPLATTRSVQLTSLTAANPTRTRTTDVRGNVTEIWTEFANGFTLAKRCVPEATNVVSSRSRYGVSLETVSVSAVTNRTEYDALGRTVAQVDGRGNVARTEYDSSGRKVASVDAVGNRTAYAYDALGQLVAVTNALGHATVYEYDLRGRKTYEGGATYPVRYAYDVFGNKVSMTTYRAEGAQEGDTTTWLYDEASGAMTNKVYADGKGPSYDYDAHGRLTRRTWARGVVTTYGYDAWNALTNTAYSDGTPSVTLAFDAMGRQARATDAAGVTTFAYDDFGANTNETVVGVAGTNTIERFNDSFGRDAGYALNGTRQSTLAYDLATGRLAAMLAAGSATPFTWNYRVGSDLKFSLAYPNGLTAAWTYDNRNELLEVRNAFATKTVSQYDFTYDAAGRRIGCAKSGSAFASADTLAYLYNVRSELTNATAAADSAYRYSYAFDDIGNRGTASERGTNTAYAANALNQYTMVGRGVPAAQQAEDDFQPQYDADGNQMLAKTATGAWTIAYNGENRPVHWTQGDTSIAMSYDRMGRRVTKGDQRFVYDGYLQIAENQTIANQTIKQFFIWDPTEKIATRPLVWNSSTFQPFNFSTSYYTHDGNKNVSEVIAADGTLAAHYEYAPFGALTAQRGESAAVNPWRFSGEYAEDETGTVYYNYRHYEPAAGRWMQRDPCEEVAGLLAYCYSQNEPIGGFDSRGGAPWQWIEDIMQSIKDAYDKVVKAYEDYSRCVATTTDWATTASSHELGLFNDKMQHCWSSCEIGEDCGAKFSVFAGVVKEFGDLFGAYSDLIDDLFDMFDGDFGFSAYRRALEDSQTDEDADMWGIECYKNGEDCGCCCSSRYSKN